MAPLTGCDDSPWDSERASLSEITDADGLGLMLLAMGMALDGAMLFRFVDRFLNQWIGLQTANWSEV